MAQFGIRKVSFGSLCGKAWRVRWEAPRRPEHRLKGGRGPNRRLEVGGRGGLANSSIQNCPACSLHSCIPWESPKKWFANANLSVINFHGSE